MAVFTLKYGDTRPILRVLLRNPDGSLHDLTGSTAYALYILVNGAVLSRAMVLSGLPTAGVVEYTWTTADWDDLPLVSVGKTKEFPMEYEIIGGTSVMTFPNGSTDTLRIVGAIG